MFRCSSFLGLAFIAILFVSCKNEIIDDSQLGVRNITVRFTHKTGAQNFSVGTPNTNSFGESYTLNKFQYYITNVALQRNSDGAREIERESYHLLDAGDTNSHYFKFDVNYNYYDALVFYVGVDSLRNVSGAQTGPLDPLNGMFWTWNSGYIMAKMEGSSPVSTEPRNELIFHIGGYSGINNSIRKVVLNLPGGAIQTARGGLCTIQLDVDINKWFSGVHAMKIADGAFAMSVSDRSKKYADNYATMFTVKSVKNR